MTIDLVRAAAAAFLHSAATPDIQPLGKGLINHTYKVTPQGGEPAIVLQAINTHVFSNPSNIIHNYQTVYNFLQRESNFRIAKPVSSNKGNLLEIDNNGNCWRATGFIEHSFTPSLVADEGDAATVARVFGDFTRSLQGMDTSLLQSIIPGFHDLSVRYNRFEESVVQAPVERLLQSTHIIASIRERKKLVSFYGTLSNSTHFRVRVMHHDCKISNILFDDRTGAVICPVDLDTVMPGLFFSDLGDMIRSISPTVDENSTEWEQVAVRPTYYEAVVNGYLESMGAVLTPAEQYFLHYSGLLIIYMQTIRFLTDFLEGDNYYKTGYPGQNLNRALNQLLLLESLEKLLDAEYGLQPY